MDDGPCQDPVVIEFRGAGIQLDDLEDRIMAILDEAVGEVDGNDIKSRDRTA